MLSDTWVLNEPIWQQATPGQFPSARWGASAMTWAGHMMLFGGSAGSSGPYLADRWGWNGLDWEEQRTTPSPPARFYAASASMGDSVVLFGGSTTDLSVGSTVRADTWTWDGADWAEHVGAGPRGRTAAAMAAMSAPGAGAVLFGGNDGTGTAIGDTWTWNGTTWTEQHPISSPPARWGAAAAALRDSVVLFGGYDGRSGSPAGFLADTWTWDGSTWTERHPARSPRARQGAMMATHRDRVYLFGGRDANGLLLGDTWVWDGQNWSELPTPVAPSPRANAAMTGP
jgi:hypothetical protein